MNITNQGFTLMHGQEHSLSRFLLLIPICYLQLKKRPAQDSPVAEHDHANKQQKGSGDTGYSEATKLFTEVSGGTHHT